MKKNNILLMAAIATTAGLTSCSNDDAVQVLTDTPMGISAGVNNLSTRAGFDATTDLQTKDFGLFLSTAGSVSTETNYKKYNTENMKFSYVASGETGSWTGTSQLLWKSNSDANTVDYIAYMPYDENATTADKVGTDAAPTAYAFSVQTDQTKEDNVKASDFLYYSATGILQTATNNNALPIAFTHKMSKLKLVLVEGTELVDLENGKFDISSVTIKDATTNTSIDLTSGNVSAAETATKGDISFYRTSSSTDATTKVATYNYEGILVPQSLTLTIEIVGNDGKTYKFTGSSAETFTSGYQYSLTLTVGRDKVTAGSFTAKPWEANNSEGDGSLETE